MIQAALLGGAFIGVLSALPIVNLANCCCLWVIGGGMLAAYLDQAPGRPNSVPRGALDGLLAGVVGAFVWLVAWVALDAVLSPIQDRMLAGILDGAVDMAPEVRAWLEMAREGGSSGVLGYLLGFLLQLFGGVVFATLGGALGALFFWRDGVEPALGGPPPPLPPGL